MLKRGRPAVDQAIAPAHGVTRDGQPVSYNRAPAPDLAPWIGRLYVTEVALPEGHQVDCGLFNDSAMIRLQLKGRWTARTADGPRALERAALAHAAGSVPAFARIDVAGFQTLFVQRAGLLGARNGAWLLQVAQRGEDVLLDRLPWSWAWVRLPWMDDPLQVQW